jgi:hypothetical protein
MRESRSQMLFCGAPKDSIDVHYFPRPQVGVRVRKALGKSGYAIRTNPFINLSSIAAFVRHRFA